MSDLTTTNKENKDLVDVAEQAKGKSIAEFFHTSN